MGVWVLATRENAGLEGNAGGVTLILVLFPNFLGKSSLEEGVAVSWELWPVNKVLWALEVGTNLGSGTAGGSTLWLVIGSVLRARATHDDVSCLSLVYV